MKNKKIVMYFSVLFIIIILVLFGIYTIKKTKKYNYNNLSEYIPEKEISEEQLRETIIVLYFLDPNTNTLQQETQKIDSKLLMDNPYKVLISLLIDGPKNNNLIKLIPEETKLNNSEMKGNVLYLDFSKELIEDNYFGKMREELIIKSIVYTLTELTEINEIKILIDGNENMDFPDHEVKFDKIFTR